jgi:hypothetical protein
VDAFSEHFNTVAPFNVAGGVLDLSIAFRSLIPVKEDVF